MALDLILDLMGGAVGEQALGWLAPNGRMVTVPTNTAAQLLEKASGMARKVLGDKSAARHRNRLLGNTGGQRAAASARECRAGTGRSRQCSRQMQQGHVKGKLILVPDGFVSHVT